MPVLMIGATEREKIAEVIAYAKANPVLFEQVRQGVMSARPTLALKDRNPDLVRPPSAHVVFPGGYQAAYSVEQQPAGLCSHLSVSVMRNKPGKMPSPEAVEMIAQEFGVPFPADMMWLEEYEPGEWAVNLVSVYAPAPEGHA